MSQEEEDWAALVNQQLTDNEKAATPTAKPFDPFAAPAPVKVLQNDHNSPLYSVKSFEELHLDSKLIRGISKIGFDKPTKIQETALLMLPYSCNILSCRQNTIVHQNVDIMTSSPLFTSSHGFIYDTV